MSTGGRPAATARRLRKRTGVSQEAFADDGGLHRTTMSTSERGPADAKLGTVGRVAAGFGVSALLREAERELDHAPERG